MRSELDVGCHLQIDEHNCLNTIIEYMYSGSLPNMPPVEALRLWGLADYLSMTELCQKLRYEDID